MAQANVYRLEEIQYYFIGYEISVRPFRVIHVDENGMEEVETPAEFVGEKRNKQFINGWSVFVKEEDGTSQVVQDFHEVAGSPSAALNSALSFAKFQAWRGEVHRGHD